jgi:ribonuclease HI
MKWEFAERKIQMIKIYVDGACKGNPGKCGAAVVMEFQGEIKSYQFHAPHGTNNISELEAIYRGLWLASKLSENVLLVSDSDYAVGVIDKNWKVKANVEMIREIKALRYQLGLKVQIISIKGHGTDEMNILADKLASEAAIKQLGRSFKLLEGEI